MSSLIPGAPATSPPVPTTPARHAPAPTLPAALAAALGDQPLNQMQQEALPFVLRARRNLLIGARTGAGKTRLAEIALVEAALRGDAGLFLAPMRAIAGEKQADWQRFAAHGLRVYKTTGDDAAFDPKQATAAQIVVTTPERLESLIRNRRLGELAERLRVVVADEVHLIGEGRRGALLEALLTRLGTIMPRARLLGMSGTVPNIDEIAAWLDADVFTSDWRPLPVEIRVHAYKPPRGRADDETERNTIVALAVTRAIAAGGASIVFCGSRAAVERCALALATEHELPRRVPKETVARAEHAGLREVLEGGVGFHHAGLGTHDRALVEGLYRDGTLRALVATSTVAAGVNLPASQVVVRDVRVGHDFISSSSILQMCGRAGRVGLADSGEAIVITPERDRAETERLLAGEPVGSALGEDLATPLCTEIALGLVRSREAAHTWYGRTLHGRLSPNPEALDVALQQLREDGFIYARPEGELMASPLGHATSGLLVQVSTATRLDRFLRSCATPAEPEALEEDLLRAVCQRSDEWGDAVGSADAGTLAGHLGVYDSALSQWAPLRLRALAAAVCLLTGMPLSRLNLPDGAAAAQTARADLPRLLGFLARRATERREPLPHVALAAEDLAASLTAALPMRGQSVLLAPLAGVQLIARGSWLCLVGVPAGLRCWVRLSASTDDYVLAPSSTAEVVPLITLATLGRPGTLSTVLADVVTRTPGSEGKWRHAALSVQVQIPLREHEPGSFMLCRHSWKVLGAYTWPAPRQLRLARYIATGVARDAAGPKKQPRRAPKPDPAAPACPLCKGPMARRKGGRGDFFGCISYPLCKGTQEAPAKA